jgi:hypothetical protein
MMRMGIPPFSICMLGFGEFSFALCSLFSLQGPAKRRAHAPVSLAAWLLLVGEFFYVCAAREFS